MGYDWDKFLVVEDGAIKLIDPALIDLVVKLIDEDRSTVGGWYKEANTLRIYYETDSIPKQEVNAMCVC